MTTPTLTVLVVGSTGSIGTQVVARSVAQGHTTRALIRKPRRAKDLDPRTQLVVGDATKLDTLRDAVQDVDAVIFTHGSSDGEAVNYGAVKNVLEVLDGRPVRIALMTSIGATARHDMSDWKRRGERLVRASGNEYTIIRPGWFDYNSTGEDRIVMRQGDEKWTGSPADGAIARREIARVLVDALSQPAAVGLTLELVAEHGPEQHDLGPVFAALDPDLPGSVDGVRDQPNMPLNEEPTTVRRDLENMLGSR